MDKRQNRPVVREVIVVEGKYDKNTLSQVVDALILTTDGFGVFKDPQRSSLFRRLAKERGLVVFTDSDGAGLVIRNHLKGILPADQVKMAYIPDVPGVEKRKRTPGKEGKLGVEGMTPQVLLEALTRAGVTWEDEGEAVKEKTFTKTTLFELGLSGTPDAKARRLALQKALDLPANLSASALCDVLDRLSTRSEVARLLEELEADGE